MRRFGYRNPHRNRRRAKRILCLVPVFLLALILLVDARIRPVIQSMSSYQAKVFATRAINDAIAQELAGENIRYDNLVMISQGSNGEITAIQTDMVALNRLRSSATDAVLECLTQMEKQTIRIPIGTLSGSQILSGRGPVVEFKVVPAGFLQTQLENRFDSAGINQTRHQIMLNMNMSVIAIIPGYSVSTDVTVNFCLAETVVVGVVPDAFTQVIGDESGLPNQIFDYGAQRNTSP